MNITPHCLDRMKERGLSRRHVAAVKKVGWKIKQSNGRTQYRTLNLGLVCEGDAVITIFKTAENG